MSGQLSHPPECSSRRPRRNHGDKRVKHVNHWLERIGESPISKRRMENLLSEARRDLWKAVYTV